MIIQIGTYKNETISFSAGTRTFSVSNFYETFTPSNIKLITINRLITGTTNQSFVIAAPGMWKVKTLINPSSGVYNITYDNSTPVLLSGDSIFITVDIEDPTYDYSLDVQKIANQTPEWGHFITQSELYDVTNQAAGTVRNVLYTEGYKNFMFAMVGTVGANNTITITFQVPLKSTCVDTDDVNWKDVTNLLTGVNSIIINSTTTPFSDIYFIDTDMIFDRVMIKVVFANGGTATNTLTLSYKMA